MELRRWRRSCGRRPGNDKRVEIVVHPVNKGVASALNTGFDRLDKDPSILYLTWVTSRNLLDRHAIEVMRRALIKGPSELGLVYSSYRTITDSGSLLSNETDLAALRQHQAQRMEKLLDFSFIGVSFLYKAQYARQAGGTAWSWRRTTITGFASPNIASSSLFLRSWGLARIDSAYSRSAARGEPQLHREYRYICHLARYQARVRRNIGSGGDGAFSAGPRA